MQPQLSALLKGTSIYSLAFVVKAISTLAIITILSHSLPAASLGTYFILLQAGNILCQLCQLGVDQGSQKFVTEASSISSAAVPPTITQLQNCIYISTACVILLLWAFWDTASGIWFKHSQESLFVYQAAIVVTLVLERASSSFLRALDHIKKSAIADGLLRQGLICVTLSLYTFLHEAPLLLSDALKIWVLCATISVAYGLVSTHRAKRPLTRPGTKTIYRLNQMLKTSAIIGLSRAVSTLRGSSDVLILGWTLGPEAAGLFGPLKRIASMVMALMPTNKMLQPMIARMHANNQTDDIGALSRAGTTISGLIGLLILAPFFVAGPWLLETMFGPQYHHLNTVLLLLLAGPIIRQFLSASLVILQMTGRHIATLGINTAFCAVALVTMTLAAKSYGLIGLAATSSALMALRFLLFTFIASRHLQTDIIYKLHRRTR